MGKYHTKQFLKVMMDLDLSLHVDKPTVPVGHWIDRIQHSNRGTGHNLSSEIRRQQLSRLGSRVVAGNIDYKGIHSKQVFISRAQRRSRAIEAEAMDSSSKPPLSPRERLDLIKLELESVRASTIQRKWETLSIEI